jgi:hypothetical protein
MKGKNMSRNEMAYPHEGKLLQRATVKERLLSRKDELEDMLKNINEALAFLEKNPDLEKFMTCIRDVGCL